MTPAEIRTLIAASDGTDQGEILEAAFEMLLPSPPNIWEDDQRKRWSDDFARWNMLSFRFQNMIDAEAYTDAAILIAEAVLPGADYTASTILDGKGGACLIELADGEQIFSEALNDGTPALAIIDAVCAAKRA